MTVSAAIAVLWCAVASGLVLAQARGAAPAAETTTPAIAGVVAAGTKVQFLQSWDPKHAGEGPIAMPDGSVLFTQDGPNRIARFDADGRVVGHIDTHETRVLGLAYDTRGRLIGTMRFPSGVVVLSPTRVVLADKYEGKALEGPNDLAVDSKGGVYFTDPVTRAEPGEPPPPPGTGVSAVYYINPSGQLAKVTDAPPRPNGIVLSPDEMVLYVASMPSEVVMALDVQPDGSVTNPRDFGRLSKPGEPGGADGLAVDAAGRLYVAANGGVHVISPQGQPLGVIPIPLKPRNLAFIGRDRKTMFVVSRGAAYQIAMLAEGPKGRAK